MTTTTVALHIQGDIDHASLPELLDEATEAIGRHAYGHVDAATVTVSQLGGEDRELVIPNAAGRNQRGFRITGPLGIRPATRDDYNPPMDPPEGEQVIEDQ